jgi:glycosyltransferase involved in cell wall biosynthesis
MFGLRGLRPDLEISGFETAFAEIAPRLVRRGHDVTIYCRKSAHSPERRVAHDLGVTLEHMASPGGKNYSAVTSTLLAVIHALRKKNFDVWFFVNVGMGHHCGLARLSGRPVVMNVDGLDWERSKWGPFARAYFRSAAHAAMRWCTRLVVDADAMQTYYRERFGCETEMIAYGADLESSERPELLEPLCLTPRGYYLIVSRLVPENSLDTMLEGFRRSRSKRPLVVVGGANYRDAFHQQLRAIADADDRIRLIGHVHDQALLKELWCNCYAYLHGHSVGGTNPALLRAMGYGSCVLALDTVFNREVLADTGWYFGPSPNDVAAAVDAAEAKPDAVTDLRTRAPQRIAQRYTWEAIADQYERLFLSVAG